MRSRGYTVFLALCALLLGGVLLARTRPLDWTLALRPGGTAPYDARVLAETLPAFLPGRDVRRSTEPLSELLDTLRAPATVVVAAPAYDAAPATLGRMLAFVRRGGTVLLLVEGASDAFADSLGLAVTGFGTRPPTDDTDTVRVAFGTEEWAVPAALAQSSIARPEPDVYPDDTTAAAPLPPDAFVVAYGVGRYPDWLEGLDGLSDERDEARQAAEDAAAGKYPPVAYDDVRYAEEAAYRDSVDRVDSLRADSAFTARLADPAHEAGPAHEAELPAPPDSVVLGVRVPLGAGQVVVFAAPRLVTNYGLLHGGGDRVLPLLLAYAPPRGPVLFDAAPRGNALVDGQPLAYVLGHPALRPAWRTALVVVFLAMAFRLRRRQRVIPVVQRPKNETVRFARVVSRLYYQRGDHAHLGRTLRRQFHAYARDTLGVAAAPGDPAFVNDVAARAAATPETVADLARRLDAVPDDDRMPARTLLALARDLDAFYAHSPRGKP